MMDINTFYNEIENGEACDYVVRIRLKYSHESGYRETNELLLFEPSGLPSGNDFVWLRDWHEGEESVQIVGYVKVHEIKIDEVNRNSAKGVNEHDN